MKVLAGLMAVVVFIAAAGQFFGYVRAGVAVAMFAAIAWLGVSYFGSAQRAPGADNDPEEIGDEEMRYVCSMCGLELTVEVLGTDKPPTHCREPMQLRVSKPPLRPIP